MKETKLPYCSIEYKESHAILEMKPNTEITIETGAEIADCLDAHFKGRNFIFITHRKYPHEIDLNVYKGKVLKNMIGFAIVSKDPNEIKRALQEQPLWNQAFTFFKELSEAENWARSFFD